MRRASRHDPIVHLIRSLAGIARAYSHIAHRPALRRTGRSRGSRSTRTGSTQRSVSIAIQNMLVGIKPTVGRISRWGIIPITADQDTAGPMARTVTDAAIMLGAMEGADAHDPATTRCSPARGRDYQQFLWLAGLRGKRIGIPRAFYYDAITLPGDTSASGGLKRRSDDARDVGGIDDDRPCALSAAITSSRTARGRSPSGSPRGPQFPPSCCRGRPGGSAFRRRARRSARRAAKAAPP